uniref:Uncharacterized protein n=1 Tax=Pipistrellus kuhlii TaxID=59472 RepID=A0A7J7XBW6_PIPKU|nr:hypothetical protein mPipKuh1_010574 [Pipistrellus kuhlii]
MCSRVVSLREETRCAALPELTGSRNLSERNTEGRGVPRNTAWETPVCWPEPSLLIPETKALPRAVRACLSSCCSGHSTDVQKVPAKQRLQLLPAPAAALALPTAHRPPPTAHRPPPTAHRPLSLLPDAPPLCVQGRRPQGPAQMPPS